MAFIKNSRFIRKKLKKISKYDLNYAHFKGKNNLKRKKTKYKSWDLDKNFRVVNFIESDGRVSKYSIFFLLVLIFLFFLDFDNNGHTFLQEPELGHNTLNFYYNFFLIKR